MAIEITREGVLPGKKPYHGTCSYCKTEFKCLQEDGVTIFDQRDGDFLQVTCPKCKRKANAYPLPGGQLIPRSRREPLTWGAESFYDR